MVTEYNRNTIIKRRMAELERKEKTSSPAETPIVETTAKETKAENETAVEVEKQVISEQTEKPKKTEAEKLSRKKKQG